jgi:peptidoglycan/LPS O-acetylase OafA/YrhL
MVVASPLDVAANPAKGAPPRQAWIDNLRVAIIAGVVGAHVSLIYALDVGWYYEERTASEVTKAVLAGVFAPGLLFGMGLLFLVAGLYTPRALALKGARRFVVDRLWRLGLPVIAYLFIVDPAMNFFGDRAMGSKEGVAGYFRHTYWDDVELGVAWFLAALLAFSLSYAGWRSRHPAHDEDAGPLRRRDLVTAAAFIAVASFAVRLVWPFLATGDVFGLNLWEYPQMFALFALGALAEERRWLVDGLTPDLRRTCGRAAALGVAMAVLVGVAVTLSEDADPFLGGLRIQATLIPVIEAMITLGMSLWAVDWFRRRWNGSGPLVRGLGRASFAAYLVHAPVTVALAVALSDAGAPTEVKFSVVLALTLAASFGLGWIATRWRVVGRVL